MEEIVNRVANSKLISLDLEELYHQGERVEYDIAQNLFQGLVLREKDFRTFVKDNDWSVYQDKNVNIICSVEAIVPTWAYMLLVTKIEPHANMVIYGDKNALEQSLFQQTLSKLDPDQYHDSKVVIKGCSNLPVPTFAYTEITRLLRPYAASIMYGEPCSTVPLYKKRK